VWVPGVRSPAAAAAGAGLWLAEDAGAPSSGWR